jgi:uncharacterized protein with HEPN domain
VTYRERQRLADIQAAIDAIRSHLQRGDLSDGLVFDAVRIRLLEIGEAVKALPAGMLSSQPAIPWAQIARMRDHLAHRYFDTNHAVLQATVDNDLPELERAVQAMAEALPAEDQQAKIRPADPGRQSASGSACIPARSVSIGCRTCTVNSSSGSLSGRGLGRVSSRPTGRRFPAGEAAPRPSSRVRR